MFFKKESMHNTWRTWTKQHDMGLTVLQPYYNKLDKKNKKKIGKGSTLMVNSMSGIPHKTMLETGMPEEIYQAAWGQTLYDLGAAAYGVYVGYCVLEDDRKTISNWTEAEHQISDGGVLDTLVKERMKVSVPFGIYTDMHRICADTLYALYQMNKEEGLDYCPSKLIKRYSEFNPDIMRLWQEAQSRILTQEEYCTLLDNVGTGSILTDEHYSTRWHEARQWIFTHNPIDWACEFMDFMWNKYQLALDVMYRHGAGIDTYHHEENLRHGREHKAKANNVPQEYKEAFACMVSFSMVYPSWAIFEFFGWDGDMIKNQLPETLSDKVDKFLELRDEWDKLQKMNWYEGPVAEDWWA